MRAHVERVRCAINTDALVPAICSGQRVSTLVALAQASGRLLLHLPHSGHP